MSVKGRRESGCFLIEGIRAVEQVILTSPQAVEELLYDEAHPVPAHHSAIPCRNLTAAQFAAITASVHPQGVAALVRIPSGTYEASLPTVPGNRIVLLDDVQDPGNVGAMVRCAAAFGCSGILLSSSCADPFGPKAVQASAGALLGLWIRRSDAYVAMVTELKNRGYRLLCADVRGRGAVDFSGPESVIIAFGNEGTGLTERISALADECFSIPMVADAVESLNVAASGAITLFAAFRGQGWRDK